MEMENRIEIRAYNKVWKFDNRIYAIQNVVLPVPVSWKQVGYFFAIFGLIFILQSVLSPLKAVPDVIRFLVIPGATTQFLLKKKLDGKMPLKYFVSWVKYVLTKSEYIERFQSRYSKNEKIKINWYCSQGFADTVPAAYVVPVKVDPEPVAYVAQIEADPDPVAYVARVEADPEPVAYVAQEEAHPEPVAYTAPVEVDPETTRTNEDFEPGSFYIKGAKSKVKAHMQPKNYQQKITKLLLAMLLLAFCGVSLFSIVLK